MNWETIYHRKVVDVDTALGHVKSGNRVYLAGGAGVPKTLIAGLTRRADELHDVEITHILTFAEAPYVQPRFHPRFFVRNPRPLSGRDLTHRRGLDVGIAAR